VRGLALEAFALEIPRTVNHCLVVVPGAAAELQVPIWAVSIGESRNFERRYIGRTGTLGV
jgi:hypothetical protein